MRKTKTIIEYESKTSSYLEYSKDIKFIFDDDYEVEENDLLNYQLTSSKDGYENRNLKSLVTPGRYGSIVSIPETTAWFLDILERIFSEKFSEMNQYTFRSDMSQREIKVRKGSLNGLLYFLLESIMTEPLSDLNKEFNDDFANSKFIRNIFEKCKTELNKTIMIKKEKEVKVFQIPTHEYTFHMVPLFRYLLLEILAPELLKEREIFTIFAFMKPETLKSGKYYYLEDSKDTYERNFHFAELIYKAKEFENVEENPYYEIDFKALKKYAKTVTKATHKVKKPSDLHLSARMISLLKESDFMRFWERVELLRKISKNIGEIKIQ